GIFTNSAGGIVTNNVLVSGGTFVNSDTASIGGTATVDSGATFQADGTSTISGNLVNNGTVDMQNGTATGNVLNVTGALSGSGTYKLDADLSSTTRHVDQVSVGSVASGTHLAFNFNLIGNSVVGNEALFFTSGTAFDTNAALSSADVSGLVVLGAVTEQVVATSDGKGFVIRTQANPAISSMANNLSLTQLVLSNIINRPTSPFVRTGTLEERACRSGGFARAVDGRATVDGSSTSSSGGAKQSTTISANYAGAQISYDYGCYDGRYNGWSLVFGGNLGLNNGSTSQSVFKLDSLGNQDLTNKVGAIKTDFKQTYAGVYVTGRKGRVQGDVQLRYDDMKYDFSEAYSAGNETYAL
ncbi:MAG: hypothetical protein B7Y02_14385, partial [Rhodobacterales bacterium 17-64-5]